MNRIVVSPRSPAPDAASSSEATAAALAPATLAFLSVLPALPPWTAEKDQAGGASSGASDPLLFQQVGGDSAHDEDAADAGHSSHMGYEFQWVDQPDQDLLCVICSNVCRDAVETVSQRGGTTTRERWPSVEYR